MCPKTRRDPVVLRELSLPEDVLALRPIILEYLTFISSELLTNYGITLDPERLVAAMMERREVFLPPLGHSFVAKDRGELLGTVFLKPLEAEKVELKRLYVQPEAQGRGLGRRLLHHAESAARRMGAKALYLDTLRSLHGARALYDSEGFEIVDIYPGSELLDFPEVQACAVFMRKPL